MTCASAPIFVEFFLGRMGEEQGCNGEGRKLFGFELDRTGETFFLSFGMNEEWMDEKKN